jgi:hypothetical protein
MRFIPAVVLVALANSPAALASIALNDGGTTELTVNARDRNAGFPTGASDSAFPAALPFSLTNHAVTHGNSMTSGDYSLDQGTFHFDFEHTRDGSLDSNSTAFGSAFFSVMSDTLYDLSGHIAADDPGSTGKVVQIDVTLSDVDTATVLFRNRQDSFGVVDESFVLGGTDGTLGNELSGSLSGLLEAGHRYRLDYIFQIYASNAGDMATATSDVRLSLSAVPEPAAALVWSGFLGFATLILRRRLAYHNCE